MSEDKRRHNAMVVPHAPTRLLKHSKSDYKSHLPEIRHISTAKHLRKTMLEPAGEQQQQQQAQMPHAFKIRNSQQAHLQTLRPSRRPTMVATAVNTIKNCASQPRLSLAVSKPSSGRHQQVSRHHTRNQASHETLKAEKINMEQTQNGLGFRLRTINQQRNKSQKVSVGKTGLTRAESAFQTTGKLIAPKRATPGEGSAEKAELTKSARNLQSDSTQSTQNSSKVGSDAAPSEPRLTLSTFHSTVRTPAKPLFSKGTTPASTGSKIQVRNRILKRPQKVCTLNHSQLMVNRWMGLLKNKLPQFDLEDQKNNRQACNVSSQRQAAPEYSQHAYLSMLQKERAIGNYFNMPLNVLRISAKDRESMVSLIQELHRVKGYAEDTFYLACSVADRYLTVLSTTGKRAPNLIQLATCAILMAAKMYQHMNPCFEMMIERLPTLLRKQVTREQLINLEEQIIRALDFNLQHDGPLPFLERYQRVLNIDQEGTNQLYYKIGYSARKLLRHMMHKATFLDYRPSQIASTAILVAIDLNKAEIRAANLSLNTEHLLQHQTSTPSLQKTTSMTKPQSPREGAFDTVSAKALTDHKHQRGASETRDDQYRSAGLLTIDESSAAYRNMARGKNPYCAVSPPSHSNYASEVCTPKKGSSSSKVGTPQHQEHTFDKVWNRQTSYYTQVSKTRDILPVLKHLVESLD